MRKITRSALPKQISRYLDRKQSEVNSGKDARRTWKYSRKTKAMKEVANKLSRMSGRRQRCMFCEDSRGTDIDHYWPLSTYKEHSFVWTNLFWICAGCNKAKGPRFDMDQAGQPLLIDPTADDPWDHLFYDSRTGNITPRYNPISKQPSPKGVYTTDANVLHLNVEAITEGRQRVQRNLQRAVRQFLQQIGFSHNPDALANELVEAIRDNNDFGLGVWFFVQRGSEERPFSELKAADSNTWLRVVEDVESRDI